MKRLPLVFSSLALVISLTAAGSFASGLVNGAGIMNHSIGIGKLTPLAVKQLKGHAGTRGFRGLDGVDGMDGMDGVQGVPGVTGAIGANGGFDLNKLGYIIGPSAAIAAGNVATVSAVCPAGTKIVGGGYDTSNVNQVGTSGPFTFPGGLLGWSAVVWNDDTSTVFANAYAVCAAA